MNSELGDLMTVAGWWERVSPPQKFLEF